MAKFTGRVGIFGGSFNPIHNGHLLCAERALEQLKLAYVLFLPNFCSPQKFVKDVAPPLDRLKMVAKAIQYNENFFDIGWEAISDEPCYTVDTMERVIGEFEKPPYWLCGADSWHGIASWKNPQRLMELVAGVGVFTQDKNTVESPAWARDKVNCVYVPRLDIRSTDVRNRLRRGLSIKYMVPDEVEDYITKAGLYRAEGVSNKA